ncbi:MAG: hypothetical protein IKZ00_00930 [Bacteroidaceae bacterium]|nr:hypothetical protein [Bacteroidaceae bacterium]
MKIQAIAHSYWRKVKRGERTFESLKNVNAASGYPSMQEQVKYLANTDVQNGVITEEEYKQYIGEVYTEE